MELKLLYRKCVMCLLIYLSKGLMCLSYKFGISFIFLNIIVSLFIILSIHSCIYLVIHFLFIYYSCLYHSLTTSSHSLTYQSLNVSTPLTHFHLNKLLSLIPSPSLSPFPWRRKRRRRRKRRGRRGRRRRKSEMPSAHLVDLRW